MIHLVNENEYLSSWHFWRQQKTIYWHQNTIVKIQIIITVVSKNTTLVIIAKVYWPERHGYCNHRIIVGPMESTSDIISSLVKI